MEEKENNQENEKTDTPQPEFESNAARRSRLMGIENDDKIHDTAAEITKGNFFANLYGKFFRHVRIQMDGCSYNSFCPHWRCAFVHVYL